MPDIPKYKPLIDSDSLWRWFLMPTPTLTLAEIERLTPVRKCQYLNDLAKTDRIVSQVADKALRKLEKRR